jgi:hypothetical protein
MQMINRLVKEQKGYTLPLALVILAVGVFIVVPLLIGMSVTLISSRNSQVSTQEQYALDGAYEDVVWDLKYGTLAELLPEPCDSFPYQLTEMVNGLYPDITVTRTDDCGGDDGQDSKIYQIYVTAGTSSLTREYVDGTVLVAAIPTPGAGATPIPTPELDSGAAPTPGADATAVPTPDPGATPAPTPDLAATPVPTPGIDGMPTATPVSGENIVLTPYELKERVVDNLSPYVEDSKKYGKRFKKAVEETKKSLDPKYWATKPGDSENNGKDVIDPYRLNLKEGKKHFDHEVKAVKELKELLKGFADEKCGGVTSIALEYTGPGIITVEVYLKDIWLGSFIVEAEDPDPESTYDSEYESTFEVSATEETEGKLHPEIRLVVGGSEAAKIHTSCSKPIEIGDVYGDFTIDDLVKLPSKDADKLKVSAESLEFARMAVEDLLTADRMLAQLFLAETMGLIADNPKNQEKVDKELEKAANDLDKGDAGRAAEEPKFDKVIKHYKKTWEHTMHAVKEAAKK